MLKIKQQRGFAGSMDTDIVIDCDRISAAIQRDGLEIVFCAIPTI